MCNTATEQINENTIFLYRINTVWERYVVFCCCCMCFKDHCAFRGALPHALVVISGYLNYFSLPIILKQSGHSTLTFCSNQAFSGKRTAAHSIVFLFLTFSGFVGKSQLSLNFNRSSWLCLHATTLSCCCVIGWLHIYTNEPLDRCT